MPASLPTAGGLAVDGDPSALAGLPPWTFPIAPAAEELLSSWLCRSAHAHGIAPYAFLSLRFPGTCFWNRDVDRGATAGLCGRIDGAARLRPGTSGAAALGSWLRVLSPTFEPPGAGAGAQVPFLLAAGIHHRKRRLHGLQYCAECLDGGEARFSRWGRLAFVVACPTHGHPLRDGCPHCDAPVVPHRAPVGDLGACHDCGRSLAGRLADGAEECLSNALTLQRLCLAALAADEERPPELPCPGRDFLALCRCLAGVTASSTVIDGRSPKPLPNVEGRTDRRHVERMRTADRITMLAVLAGWLADWPDGFRARAREAGLTKRTFARTEMPAVLAAEVARLDGGTRRHRPVWRSLLDDAAMRRLRMNDRSAFRSERARRILSSNAEGTAREKAVDAPAGR